MTLSFLIVKAARLNNKNKYLLCAYSVPCTMLHIKYLSKIIKHNCFPRSTSFIQQINMPRIILYGEDTEVNAMCPCKAYIPSSILVLTWSEVGKHWKVLSREMTWFDLENVLADAYKADTYICLNWWRGYLSILGKRWYGMWNKLGQVAGEVVRQAPSVRALWLYAREKHATKNKEKEKKTFVTFLFCLSLIYRLCESIICRYNTFKKKSYLHYQASHLAGKYIWPLQTSFLV